MKTLSVNDLRQLVDKHGLNNYLSDMLDGLRKNYARWDDYEQIPRIAMHLPYGVLELMPIRDDRYYAYKYVNCHPKNPEQGLQTVVATGQLAEVSTGYPLMFSEMTVLTALRTAANSALGTDLMARKDAHRVALIGTGAQSEFQSRALMLVRDIKEIHYYDTDPKAMDKFEKNMKDVDVKLVRHDDAESAVRGSDIVTVCTACKDHVNVIKNDWLEPGMHINGVGGDCPGKTELEQIILDRSRVVVEYFEQSYIEGEIQRLERSKAKEIVHAELHEVINGEKTGRGDDSEVTLFDSVGIALEDYTALEITYELAKEHNLGEERDYIPDIQDPKDLIGSLL